MQHWGRYADCRALFGIGLSPAGEQRRRNYEWNKAGIDPAAHRFGAFEKNPERDGVRKAMQPSLDPTLQVGNGVQHLEDCGHIGDGGSARLSLRSGRGIEARGAIEL